MNSENGQKSSAELEQEVNAQRDRVEARISGIKERLSPGQLMDEVLSYTRDGGGKFATNLGQQITANPLPAALVGVGLAWLIASNVTPHAEVNHQSVYDDDYPYARLPSGGLKRVSHAADETGQWWSEFESGTGSRYKARSDSLGRRAGHFTDSAGKKFGGFIDDTGNRVRQFQDDAGNTLDDAKNWASHTWRDVQQGAGEQLRGATATASRLASGARDASGNLATSVQSSSDQLTRQIGALFDQQPLIAGALAFAAGAALGAALPHTAQEDALIGGQADKVRGKAVDAATALYDQNKDKASELYDEVKAKTGEVYDQTKGKIADVLATDQTTD